MAARTLKGATVNPSDVTDVNSWLRYYKLKRVNIQMGEDGSLLVLDPALLKTPAEAYERPAKVIPHLRADDMTVVLARSTNPELRAVAEEKRKALSEAIQNNVTTTSRAYTDIEGDLLKAVDTWKVADSAATRSVAALEVGTLSREIADADEAARYAMYPQRRIFSEKGIQKKQIHYATHDERSVGYLVHRIMLDTTTPADRALPIVEDKP